MEPIRGYCYYQATILSSLGITAQARLLTFNLADYVATLGSAVAGSLISERVGRRPLLIFGCLSMSACLVGLSATTSHFTPTWSPALSNLTIAFIFFVGIFHTFGINPLVVAYPVEVLDTNTRAKGMALNSFALNCAEFINTYATPIALARMGWKLYCM
jgi:MFS family permease